MFSSLKQGSARNKAFFQVPFTVYSNSIYQSSNFNSCPERLCEGIGPLLSIRRLDFFEDTKAPCQVHADSGNVIFGGAFKHPKRVISFTFFKPHFFLVIKQLFGISLKLQFRQNISHECIFTLKGQCHEKSC